MKKKLTIDEELYFQDYSKIIGLKDREDRIATSKGGLLKVEGLKGNKTDYTFIGQFLKVLQRENRKGNGRIRGKG
jgi:hypothetical protein